MGRPIKEGMDYFPHDTDASNDEKIEALQALYKNDGYAFYFKLLERIYRNKNAELDISNPAILASVISKIGVSKELFFEILETAFSLNCLDRNAYEQRKVLTSYGIKRRAEEVESMRERWRKRKEKPRVSSVVFPAENSEETGESKEKKSKVKESKYINYYINNINPVASPIEIEKLCDWENDLPEDVICLAIEKAVEQNKRNLSYIEAILRNWLKENLVTVEAVRFKEKERKGGQNGRTSGNPQPNNREGQSELDGIDFSKFEFKE